LASVDARLYVLFEYKGDTNQATHYLSESIASFHHEFPEIERGTTDVERTRIKNFVSTLDRNRALWRTNQVAVPSQEK
jgi:hypothetical protein